MIALDKSQSHMYCLLIVHVCMYMYMYTSSFQQPVSQSALAMVYMSHNTEIPHSLL